MFIYGNNNKIDFRKLHDITGINDKNGVGKSSLIDILLFSVFGIHTRGDCSVACALKIGRRECNTTVTLYSNKDKFKITRTCKKQGIKSPRYFHNIELYKNNKLILTATKKKEIDEINNYINNNVCKHSDIINQVIILQQKLTGFTQMNSDQRKKYLFDIVNLEIFNKLYDEIKASKVSLDHKIGTNTLMMKKLGININNNNLNETINDIDKQININKEEINVNNKEKDILNQTVGKIKNEIILMTNKIVDINEDSNDIKIYEKNINDCNEKIKRLSINEKKLKRTIKRYQKNIQILREQLEDEKQIKNNNEQFENNKKEEINKINTKINEYYMQIKNKYDVLLSEENINNKLNSNRIIIDGFRKEIEKYVNMFTSNKITKAQLINNIIINSTNVGNSNIEIDRLNRMIKELKKNKVIDNNNKMLYKLIKVNEEEKSTIIKKTNIEYELFNKKQQVLFDLSNKISKEKNHLEEIREELKDVKDVLEFNNNKLLRINERKNQIQNNEQYKVNINNKENELVNIKIEINKLNDNYNKLLNLNKELNVKLENMKMCKKNMETIYDEKIVYMNLINIMKPKNNEEFGIIDYIMGKKILPNFEKVINRIADNINLGYQIHMTYYNKNIGIYISKDDEEDRKLIEISNTSGYESDIFNLLCRYAVIKINSNFTSNFFIIDEGVKYSDIDNKEIIKNLIQHISQSYEWMLLISHNVFIKDLYNTDFSINKISKTESNIYL